MKQGRADRSGLGNQKIEPRPRVAYPGGVDGLGQQFGNHTVQGDIAKPNITSVYGSRGYKAPGIRSTTSKSGSQGKY
jgi:hypothetical protein